MKTREYIDKIQANRWVRTIALGFAAFIVFSYMYTCLLYTSDAADD